MKNVLKKLISHTVSVVLTSAVIAGFLAFKPMTSSDVIGEIINDSTSAVSEYVAPEVQAQCGGDELLWLACGIYFEARSESIEGQYWVANVILNRMENPRWPNTIEGVLRQGETRRNRCQFSFMCDGQPEHISNKKAWQTALQIATVAMEDFYQDVRVTCAHSYHAEYVTSKPALKWFATLQADEQVDTHIFYCDKVS